MFVMHRWPHPFTCVGMDADTLNGWAKHAKPTAERMQHDRGAVELANDNLDAKEVPFQVWHAVLLRLHVIALHYHSHCQPILCALVVTGWCPLLAALLCTMLACTTV